MPNCCSMTVMNSEDDFRFKGKKRPGKIIHGIIQTNVLRFFWFHNYPMVLDTSEHIHVCSSKQHLKKLPLFHAVIDCVIKYQKIMLVMG